MHAEIARLLDLESDSTPLITLYLDARLREGRRMRRFQSWLGGALKNLAQGVPAHGPVREAFDRDLTRIERRVAQLEARTQGAALFACDGLGLFQCFEVEEPFENQAALGSRPVLYPLVRYLNTQVSYAVVLADSEQARIYAVRVGHITEAVAAAHPREHPERPGRGAGPGRGPVFGASQKSYQRYLRQQTREHLQEVVQALEGVVTREGLAMIVLAGNPQVTAQLELLLPEPLKDKCKASARLPMTANQGEVLQETLKQLEEALSADRKRKQHALVEDFLAGGLAVVGPEATLEALYRGQVEELLLSPPLQATARMCLECKLPTLSGSERCQHCEGKPGPEVDLNEALATQLERTGGHLELIPAGGPLDPYGGMGANLRYRL